MTLFCVLVPFFTFMFLINTALELGSCGYLVFNVNAVIAPANANKDIPKNVSDRD